jgi:2-oxoglutarate dehydrogenase E2 component (dihydrolipoamide succinyltransferase)
VPQNAAVPPQKQAPPAATRNADLSPAVRRLLAEHGLAPDQVAGTGRDGRITADDVLRHAALIATPAVTRVPHTPMRRRIAEHMARSVAAAPHVTTVFEADVTRVLAHRNRYAPQFLRDGVHLTLTAYFVAAAVAGLRAVPEVNSTFHADHLELHPDCNIGVGTALGNEGLIVPVIHRAQALDLRGIAREMGTLVGAARAGKLTADAVRGGTFTISNHGVSGSLLAAPIIINQPQVAILGVGKMQRRVVVDDIDGEDAMRVRAMCYLTLTIDHRAIDAFQANAFLTKVVETLERWSSDG